MSNEEINRLSFNDKKEYLKLLLEKYKLLNEQIDSLSKNKGSK